jgi:hypothetical protein
MTGEVQAQQILPVPVGEEFLDGLVDQMCLLVDHELNVELPYVRVARRTLAEASVSYAEARSRDNLGS